MLKTLHFMAAAAVLAGTSAQAAEKRYNFSGTLATAYQYSAPIPEWQFAAGQRFTGTLVYDASAVSSSGAIIDTPEWQLMFHSSPIKSLSFSIALPGEAFQYNVPTEGLSNAAWHYAAVGKIGEGPGGWSGVNLRTFNYPIGWQANPPSAPVPQSAYVGSYNPHSVDISINDVLYSNPNAANLLANTSADQDLAALFNRTSGESNFLGIRFSDSSRWLTPGTEHIDAFLSGRLETFALATGVPEPMAWTMMIIGFGFVGGTMRQRRKTAIALPA